MKERPILFSGAMVRALLDGRKTQTRRVVRKQFGTDAIPAEVPATSPEGWQISGHSGRWWDDVGGCDADAVNCPFGVPGDHLWVRETWNTSARCLPPIAEPYIYAADLNSDGVIKWAATWKPSIHMPRAASRITLEVTSVRVERLQSMSVGDLCAEGIGDLLEDPDSVVGRAFDRAEHFKIGGAPMHHEPEIYGYAALWDSLNAARGYGWDVNPWVWVVEFKRVQS